jgi:hypothetical protein
MRRTKELELDLGEASTARPDDDRASDRKKADLPGREARSFTGLIRQDQSDTAEGQSARKQRFAKPANFLAQFCFV